MKNKFRICYTAQDGSKSIIYNNDRFLIGLDGTIYENYGKSWIEPMWENVFDTEPPILQQNTGCNDKNKTDIYEGDKISYKGKIGVVELFAGSFVCSWDDQTFDELGRMIIRDIEIVGNVYENI